MGKRPAPVTGSRDPETVLPTAASPFEQWLWWGVLALTLPALALRVPLLFNARLGTDEVKHLHAAWAVAHGQVPYRDFHQTHGPLLYYLMAPVFTLMGEDLRVIYVGRGLMLLCLLLILVQLYRIARESFDPLTGVLAVLLLSYLLLWWKPVYSFRPDTPQTLLVLLSLWRFMQAWEHHRRGALMASGALLGVALWFLLKTLFPLVGLTMVFVLSTALRRSAAALRDNLTGLLLFLAGFTLPVVLGGILLWVAGAWPAFLRWVVVGAFRFPDRFPAVREMELDVHVVFFALALVGVGQAVTRMVRARVVDEVRLAPLLAGSVTAAIYLFLMPAPYKQSALPFLPLAAMYAAEVVRGVVVRAVSPGIAPRLGWAALATLLLVGSCVPPVRALVTQMPPFQDNWPDLRQTIRYVLALTSPADSVFDGIGLYIFRPHATYYYRLSEAEGLWLRSGLISPAEIMHDLWNSQCKVVIVSHHLRRLPQSLLKFLQSHYIPTGFQASERAVFVAGKVLRRADLPANHATISLIASGEYAVLVRGGTPRVTIDGQVYRAPLFLAQGDHQLVVEGDFESVVILYSRVLAVPVERFETSAKGPPDRTVPSPSQDHDQ